MAQESINKRKQAGLLMKNAPPHHQPMIIHQRGSSAPGHTQSPMDNPDQAVDAHFKRSLQISSASQNRSTERLPASWNKPPTTPRSHHSRDPSDDNSSGHGTLSPSVHSVASSGTLHQRSNSLPATAYANNNNSSPQQQQYQQQQQQHEQSFLNNNIQASTASSVYSTMPQYGAQHNFTSPLQSMISGPINSQQSGARGISRSAHDLMTSSSSQPMTDPLGPLPDGWQMAFTDDGSRYFMNHHTRITTWYDPRMDEASQRAFVQAQHGVEQHQQVQHGYQGSLDSRVSNMSYQQQQQHAGNIDIGALQREQASLRARQQELYNQGLMNADDSYWSPSSDGLIQQQSTHMVGSAYPSAPSPMDTNMANSPHLRQPSNGSVLDDFDLTELNPQEFDRYMHQMQ